MVETAPETAALNAGAGGRVSLRIGIDEQYPVPPTSDNGGKIDRGSGLTDSAFLIRYGYYSSHYRAGAPFNRCFTCPAHTTTKHPKAMFHVSH